VTAAIATLTAAYDSAWTGVGASPDRDRDIVVVAWPSVPIEIVRAAGLRPVVVRGSADDTAAADAHLEADIFPSRLRQLMAAALAGRLATAAGIVVPRTSDADYKCFLYLREFVRRGLARSSAPTLLFDLLQSHGPDVPGYNAARARALFEELSSKGGASASVEHLQAAIAAANDARAALRRLLACRQGRPRITGTGLLPLIGAFWQMAPTTYAVLAHEAADDIAARPVLAGPRIVLAGAPVDGPALHQAIESRGGIVVAEPGPWGSGAAGDDVRVDDDPVAALADRYRSGSFGPRLPINTMPRWTEPWLDDIDGVVVSLPPDDTTFGWDYPALRDMLTARGVPHTCVLGDPWRPLSSDDAARLDALVAAAAPLTEARHG
jgi:benzoyl-CoA reductase/2-hydroxyglutaryl-CoA dehydratase subunit BcrC/BadD/HgdB